MKHLQKRGHRDGFVSGCGRGRRGAAGPRSGALPAAATAQALPFLLPGAWQQQESSLGPVGAGVRVRRKEKVEGLSLLNEEVWAGRSSAGVGPVGWTGPQGFPHGWFHDRGAFSLWPGPGFTGLFPRGAGPAPGSAPRTLFEKTTKAWKDVHLSAMYAWGLLYGDILDSS